MAIDNRHDFHAFSALRGSDFQPATLGHSTKSENAVAQFCSSGSSAAACAMRANVENPQDRFKHTTRRSRFAPRTSFANILLRKMIPDAFPLLVRKPSQSTFISDRQQSAILRQILETFNRIEPLTVLQSHLSNHDSMSCSCQVAQESICVRTVGYAMIVVVACPMVQSASARLGRATQGALAK
jgi:hypothetical protein